MVCIYCSSDTTVTNSRLQKRRNEVWRRRMCVQCEAVFTTHEQADYEALWLVIDTAGAQRSFSRDKLFISLYKSLQHRPTATSDASSLTDTVIQKIRLSGDSATINPTAIVQIVQVALHRFDTAASVHYQAFHKL